MKRDLIELLEILERDGKIYSILKQCPYEILREIHVKHYPKKQFLLNQGEVHDVFYIIVEGKANIYVESEHGKKYFLNTYGKGQYIGELEMFQKMPYISSVEAQDEIITLEISRDNFLKWIKIDSNFNEYIIRTLCDSTYIMCKNMGQNTLYSLKQRVCQYLIDNADKEGSFRIPIRTETLGEQMAVTQRSINRVIKQLKEKGIIDIDKNGMIVKDYDALLEEKEIK